MLFFFLSYAFPSGVGSGVGEGVSSCPDKTKY